MPRFSHKLLLSHMPRFSRMPLLGHMPRFTHKPPLSHKPPLNHKPLLGAALILLTLTACTGQDGGQTAPHLISTSPSTPSPSAADPDAAGPSAAGPSASGPSATAVIDCGTFSFGLSPQGLPGSAITCFVNAVRADRRARLQVTRSTTEGDPIPVTYLTDQDDVAEVRVETDSRQDNFGTQTVTRQTCSGMTAGSGRLAFKHCSDATG
jgi:hypothetical protein